MFYFKEGFAAGRGTRDIANSSISVLQFRSPGVVTHLLQLRPEVQLSRPHTLFPVKSDSCRCFYIPDSPWYNSQIHRKPGVSNDSTRYSGDTGLPVNTRIDPCNDNSSESEPRPRTIRVAVINRGMRQKLPTSSPHYRALL